MSGHHGGSEPESEGNQAHPGTCPPSPLPAPGLILRQAPGGRFCLLGVAVIMPVPMGDVVVGD